MPSGLFYLKPLDWSISNKYGVWLFLYFILCLIEIPILNANSADPDQTPRSVCLCPFYGTLGLHLYVLMRRTRIELYEMTT